MTWFNAGFIVLGLTLLAFGGDRVVSGGVRAAQVFRLPPVVIGVVLLGFGTSLPELFTSLSSVFAGAPAIAVGNIVGSNIANLLLIGGFAAALTSASAASRRLVARDGAIMLAATFAFAVILYFNALGPATGAALLFGLALFFYLALSGWTAGGESDVEAVRLDPNDEPQNPRSEAALALGVFALGVALTVVGARALVEGAVDLARTAGVPEAVIGATIVAIGTSLPELAATLAAALKGRGEMALGNIIGSNIFNLLAIGGATALFGAIQTPATVLSVDLWILLAATIATLIMSVTYRRLSRAEGVLLLMLYGLYLWLSVLNADL